MQTSFKEMLAVGGKSNSLGKAHKVVAIVLNDKSRLDELYNCLFDDDAWVRMRAIDSLEKICRVHSDWLEPYIDRLSKDFAGSSQASIQWHLAEIFGEVTLTPEQKRFAIKWLKQILSSKDTDWIVVSNCMKTLMQFTHDGSVLKSDTITLLKLQTHHKSPAVVKRANKLFAELSTN